MTAGNRSNLRILGALVIISVVASAVAIIADKPAASGWIDPTQELPTGNARVVGQYATMTDWGARLLSRDVVYHVSVGETVEEYWIEYIPGGGAGLDFGRPYRWQYPPEIPDRLLAAIAKEATK